MVEHAPKPATPLDELRFPDCPAFICFFVVLKTDSDQRVLIHPTAVSVVSMCGDGLFSYPMLAVDAAMAAQLSKSFDSEFKHLKQRARIPPAQFPTKSSGADEAAW